MDEQGWEDHIRKPTSYLLGVFFSLAYVIISSATESSFREQSSLVGTKMLDAQGLSFSSVLSDGLTTFLDTDDSFLFYQTK